MFYVVLLISVILGFFIFKILLGIYRLNTYLSDIPKPQPCSWFLGHSLAFPGFKDIFPETTKIVNDHGGLIRVIIPPTTAVMTTDKNVIRAVLKNHGAKGHCTYFLKPWLEEGLFTSEGTKWRERKKILSVCFGNLELLKHFIRVFEEKGNDIVDALETKIDEKCLNMMPFVKKYTIDVLCGTALGVPMKSSHYDSYTQSVENLCTIIGNRLQSPFKKIDLFFRFTEDYRIHQESLKIVNAYFDEVFEDKLKQSDVDFNKKERLTILDSLIRSYTNDGRITKDDIREEVNTFMFAGYDTSSIAMAFILYLLAQNPRVQEKVVQEQIDIFGSLTPDEPINYDHLQRMRYLETVMMESLRLYPSAPLIGRMLSDDIHLENGIVLPKSCVVLLYIYGCHHNPKYFPEPEKFIPERFEKDDIESNTYLPFGTGQRVCIGKKFAILETKSCISKIIRKFRLLPSVPDTKPQLIFQMLIASKNGVNISLERRNTE
uniref:Cytochrome P450 n=1 Tax=Phaedon brassicae TaxID=154011 RepID=A0A9Y1PSW9_9CUCU|nr:cytochrome P450 [Phaedon brassicae]